MLLTVPSVLSFHSVPSFGLDWRNWHREVVTSAWKRHAKQESRLVDAVVLIAVYCQPFISTAC